MPLTNKNQLFIAEYLIDGNATQAAIRAGYSEKTAYSIGARLLKNVEISAAIEAKKKERIMQADEVLSRLSDIASGDISDLMDFTSVGFTFSLTTKNEDGKLVPNPKTKLIKRVKQKVTTYSSRKEDGEDREVIETEIELLDQQTALNTLAKHHKLLVDRTELSGPDGGAIPIEQFDRALKKVYGDTG